MNRGAAVDERQRWLHRVARLPGTRLARRSRPLRALARRAGLEASNPRPVAPACPVGAKLELTYRCNLRCGFCYTDSPRRTLERAPELSDAAWRTVVAQAIEAGIVEAVLSGGEPLLRRELVRDLIARLSAAGVTVNLTTNGWF